MAASYSNSFTLNTHIENICSLLSNTAFSDALKFRFLSRTPIQNGMRFCFSNGVNFSSWGENIDIDVFFMSETASQVVIKSECAMPTQIVDWGKNKQNVNKIYSHLSSAFAGGPVMAPPQPVAAGYNSEPEPVYQQPAAPVAPAPTPAPETAARPKFCQNCGASLSAATNFCPVCGSRIM